MPPDVEQTEIVYEGWNGAVFHWSGGDLQGAEGVGFAMASQGSAFEDMYESPKDTIYNSTSFEVGGTYEGLKEKMFEFTLAFHIKAIPGISWRIVDSRFRKAMSFTKNSRLRVKVVGESERWLNVRLRGHPKLKVETDPNRQRYGLLLVTFVAPYPRWVESDWTSTAVAQTDTTSTGQEILSVTVCNQSDQEQWAKWMVQAGNAGITWTLPDFSWGDDRFNRPVQDAGRMIVMPALTVGENILVDTDPLAIAGQVVSSLDTQVYQRMNGRMFMYPIPAYTSPTTITVAVSKAQPGNGIQVRVPRTWSRPWGLE